jgi:hypothetical protein
MLYHITQVIVWILFAAGCVFAAMALHQKYEKAA